MNPFTLDELEFPQGDGSGFLWDEHGHIVTNYHVIQGASNVKFVFFLSFYVCFIYRESGFQYTTR